MKYLYVTGANYSGSTLLAFLLNAHPEMVSIGEPYWRTFEYKGRYGPETLRCSCGCHLLECTFFLELERRVRELGSTFSIVAGQVVFETRKSGILRILLERPLPAIFLERLREPLILAWPGYRQTISAVERCVYHVAQAAMEITGKQVSVDMEKDPMRIKFLQGIPGLDLKVIHLIRDVRGAVGSFITKKRRGLWPKWPIKSPEVAQAALWWRFVNMNSERARRFVSPDRWLRVHYEDLCADPQGAVDAIADFVGVDRAPVPANFYATTHHIIGNRMRMRRSDPGIVRQDDSWKSRLQARDLALIARIAGKASRSFGFSWP